MTQNRRVHSFEFLHIEAEIVQLHQFFQYWYNKDIDFSEENFSRLSNVLADSFKLVSPDGIVLERLPLLDGIHQAHNKKNGMRIWIEEVRVEHWFDELVLATYHECQDFEGNATVRLSSVLFRKKPGTPNELEWLHVHETWLDRSNV